MRRLDADRVRRNFSRRAAEYDRYAVVQKTVVERLLDVLLETGAPVGRAFEVGTGTGALAEGLLRRFPEVHPVLSDIAHEMTRLTAGRLPGVAVLDADARFLPLRDGCVDLVLSSSVYQWVEDLPGAFGEAGRVLRPGGRFAFALFGEHTLRELRDAHRRAAAETGLPSHVQQFPTEEEVCAALRMGGFSDVRLCSSDEVEHHPDVPTLLRGLKRIGAGNATLSRPPGLASRRLMQQMIAVYEREHRRDGVIPATYHVLYAVAFRR